MIAVSLNTWNEDRKSQAKFNQILKKVHQELIFNLNSTESLAQGYEYKNQDLYKVLNKKVTLEDYKKSDLWVLILNYSSVNLSNEAANKLEGFSDQLNVKQDSLLSRIITLYNTYKDDMDAMDQKINTTVNVFNSQLRNNKSWYYFFGIENDLPEEAYNYFLTDSFYLNHVARYDNIGLSNHLGYSYSFNLEAKVLYQDLTQYLEMEIDTTIIKDIKELKHYVGLYKLIDKNSDESIIIKDDQERLTYSFTNETITYPFYPSTRDEFMLNGRFGKLLRNESNEVTGFIRSLGGRKPKEYKKVNND